MEEVKYNPTCLITGQTDNLRMYAIRDENGNMIGWVFLHQDCNFDDVIYNINWKFKTKESSKCYHHCKEEHNADIHAYGHCQSCGSVKEVPESLEIRKKYTDETGFNFPILEHGNGITFEYTHAYVEWLEKFITNYHQREMDRYHQEHSASIKEPPPLKGTGTDDDDNFLIGDCEGN